MKSKLLLGSIMFALVVCLGVPTTAQESEQANWSQWRGPNRDGNFTGDPLPAKLDD